MICRIADRKYSPHNSTYVNGRGSARHRKALRIHLQMHIIVIHLPSFSTVEKLSHHHVLPILPLESENYLATIYIYESPKNAIDSKLVVNFPFLVPVFSQIIMRLTCKCIYIYWMKYEDFSSEPSILTRILVLVGIAG
jgi:hypothetical protein